MIFEKKVLNSELKYDTDEEKLYRFNKKLKKWVHVNPGKHYCNRYKKDVFNRVTIDKRTFLIYRIIYFVCNNDFDIFNSKIEIDHRNGDHNDNRLENLRTCNCRENQQNRKTCRGKEVKGYSETKWGTFQAKCTDVNGKRKYKNFKTKEEARKFYLKNTPKF